MRCRAAIILLALSASAHAAGEYTFLWWSEGWRGRAAAWQSVLHLQTNCYGAAFDVCKPALPHLGAIENPFPYDKAVEQSNDVVTRLPEGLLRLSMEADGAGYACVSAANRQEDEANFPVRIIESGRFVQRFDVLNAVFKNDKNQTLDAGGRIEIIAWPDKLRIVSEITAQKDLHNVRLSLAVGERSHLCEAIRNIDKIAAGTTEMIGVTWPQDDDITAAAEDILVRDIDGAARLPVTPDPLRGWLYVDLPERTWNIAAEPDRLDSFPLRITNSRGVETTYNLLFAFDGGAFQGITGLCPMLRDINGNPSGIPVQISKNWHRHRDRSFLYEGPWLHAITRLKVAPGETWEGSFAITYARWGGVPSASHAQLCLIGWGVNQLWDQAAIGSWGESITYDPDLNLNRSMIDDIRPLMTTGMNGGQWEWTCNVGGGDFLLYIDSGARRQFLTRMRTAYRAQGPNLTDVVYAGISADQKISARIEVSTPRCDDVNRAYHRFRYDVLAPTPFQRMAFYQLGADHYNDHQFDAIARGNAAGLEEEWKTEQGGKTYLRSGMECLGRAPWFSLHRAQPNPSHPTGAWANRGLVIRSWKARLGGKEIPQPHAAVYGTEDGIPSANIELTPPPGMHALLPGDFVEAQVELLVLPMSAGDYYGPNQALRDDLAATADTWRPVFRLARENALEIHMEKGTLLRLYPPVIALDDNKAIFEINGGTGYVPITFTELRKPAGYALTCDGAAVDQHCHGNDFWQTGFSPKTGTWSHTYNVCLDAPEPVNHRHQFSFTAP